MKKDIVEKYKRVVAYGWEEDEERRWLCASDMNALCEFDKKHKKCRVIAHYPYKESWKDALCATVARNNDTLVFCPYSSDYIALYDMKTEQTTFIELEKNDDGFYVKYDPFRKFYNICIQDEWVYLFGVTYPAIIRVSVRNHKVEYFREWINEYERKIGQRGQKSFFNVGIVKKNEKVFLTTSGCAALFEFSLDSGIGHVNLINCGFEAFSGLAFLKNKIWLSDVTKEGEDVICFDIESRKTTKLSVDKSVKGVIVASFDEKIVFYNDGVFQVYNPQNGYREEFTFDSTDGQPFSLKCVGKKIYFDTSIERKWYEWEPGKMPRKTQFIVEDDGYVYEEWKRKYIHYNDKEYIIESEKCGLAEFELFLSD